MGFLARLLTSNNHLDEVSQAESNMDHYENRPTFSLSPRVSLNVLLLQLFAELNSCALPKILCIISLRRNHCFGERKTDTLTIAGVFFTFEGFVVSQIDALSIS